MTPLPEDVGAHAEDPEARVSNADRAALGSMTATVIDMLLGVLARDAEVT